MKKIVLSISFILCAFVNAKAQTPCASLSSLIGSDAQHVAVNTPITNITYYFSGGVSGATYAGLPEGISSIFVMDTGTISGTPTVTGSYTYTVTTTGSCVEATTGNITVHE